MLAHDPRVSNDRSHKVETSNLALLDAEHKLRDGNDVNWAIVATMADHCDNVAGSYEERVRRRFSLTSLFAGSRLFTWLTGGRGQRSRT